MRKLLLFLTVVAGVLLVLPGVAFAQDTGSDLDSPTTVFPITLGALLAFGISSVVIPYLTAYASAPDAPAWVTSGVTTVLAGLTALAAWVVDVPGIPDWKAALGLFISTVAGASVYRIGIEPTGATERGTPHSLYARPDGRRRGLQLGKRAA